MLLSYYYVLAVLRIAVEGDGDGPGVDAWEAQVLFQ
jgi:hypothetical protein